MMANLIVVVFDNPDEAQKVRRALRDLEHQRKLSLEDAAVVVKDENGQVQVKDQVDAGVKTGVVTGGILGLLLALIFTPLVGVLIGAGAGVILGKLGDVNLDKKFVQDVTETLRPGTSAIFLMVNKADPEAVLTALRPFKGTIYQTTLPSDKLDALRGALKERTN
jgi:uncharacterized membrane protein